MNLLKRIGILFFAVVIIIPLIFFNVDLDSVSLIDNRKLAGNPFKEEGSIITNIENFISDRIGFRDEAITAYTVFHDKLFGEMVHPSYVYGKDGYVFGSGITTGGEFNDYHVVFADMVQKIQIYCENRDVPFLFVFNPSKPSVYSDKIAVGTNYDREWVDLFLNELDDRGINYLDNTKTLIDIRKNGIDGYNVKYDANHWNDIGAFYGTQEIIKKLDLMGLNVQENDLKDFNVGQVLKESLSISEFPINEYVPSIGPKYKVSNLTDKYSSELYLDQSYKSFGYYVNPSENAKNTPKLLVFQGSYMNSYGYKFLQNAFNEYIHVHDYQNVIDFPYYFNIFQPECVVFEVAEAALREIYFNYKNMKNIDYNPAFSTVDKNKIKAVSISDDLTISKGDTLTTITWNNNNDYSYVWMELDNFYDMKKVDCGYQIVIETSTYESYKDTLKFFVYK